MVKGKAALNIYEQGTLKEITGETLRPGGFDLTREAFWFCGFSRGAAILDVGCGSGATVRFLIEQFGLNAMGVDASQVMIEKGKSGLSGLPLLQGRGESLPISDKQIDGVLMECSFSLMENADAALSECYRVLRDNGRLIVGDVYFKNQPEMMGEKVPVHSCLMGAGTKDALLAKLEAHGFEVEFWQDKSKWLDQMVVDAIMKFGSADMLWNCVLPCSLCQTVSREQIRAWKPGYFLLIAHKKASGSLTVDEVDVEDILGETESVCPVCLNRIPAERVKVGHQVFLRKTCAEHGDFKTVIWRGEPAYTSWYEAKKAERPQVCLTSVDKGCPFDCGLCPEHRQQSCCVLLEVTQRCNLKCPVCFANAGNETRVDPTIDELRAQLQALWEAAGKCNIQLSGGEPTMREDLPEIIAVARAVGFSFFQLNTNGLRLAEDEGYVRCLKEAGLSTVFLQFDGTNDEVYRRIRGRGVFENKARAIENCARHQLGVVLVPTLVPGVNSDSIGEIIRYALSNLPVVRGVHFQPVSYFGRYPGLPTDKDRMTLPEVMTAIETQTNGLMKVEHFAPAGCENNLCSFHGDFISRGDGSVIPLTRRQKSCCCSRDGSVNDGSAQEAVLAKRSFVRKRWSMPDKTENCCDRSALEYPEWDELLDQLINERLSISCMAFQDAENLDLERLRDCCLHVISDDRIIPFCAYNLSSREGRPLYREQGE